MESRRRQVVLLVGTAALVAAWEFTLVRSWLSRTYLIPSRVMPLDERHDNGWNEPEQCVVSYLTRYIDPATGEAGLPHLSGPILTRNPSSGETSVVVDSDHQNLSDKLAEVERFIRPAQWSWGLERRSVDGRYYTTEVLPPQETLLPKWVPARLRLWLHLNVPGMGPTWPCDPDQHLSLMDAATDRKIAVVDSLSLPRQVAFASDGSGFVLIHSDRCEWYDLPPRVGHDSVWMQALLPVVGLALIAFLRRRASRHNRAPLKPPEGGTPTD